MGGYLLNFIVYTTAMIGIIFVALFVYKKTAINAQATSKNKILKIEDTISLAPRKQLFVIKAGNEHFLVASDAERTSLISKLDINTLNQHNVEQIREIEIPEKGRHFKEYTNSKSAIRNFAKRIDL